MAKCDFCHKNIEPGTGKKFIQKDGRILDFCTLKCQKHTFKLKHKGRLTKWTKTFAAEKKANENISHSSVKSKKKKAK